MRFPDQADFGTPEIKLTAKTKLITATINGTEITVAQGTSIMRAAKMLDVDIPKLCASDNLKPHGSCRLCVIEIAGRRGTPASCTTPLEPGMAISTETPKLAKLRRGVMELYISDHPLDCLTCSANGDCELQDMAGVVGLREVRYGLDGKNHSDAPTDTSNPYFSFEGSKCISCERCVRACEEVQGSFALTTMGRGFSSAISAGANDGFLASECVSCGACVQACPTATLTEKTIIDLGQPDRAVKTTCAYCGVGCSFIAEMKGNQVVRMTPDKTGGANQGHSCIKGRFAFGYATHKDRITQPMIRDKITDPWQPVSWDVAINTAAKRLTDIQAKHGRKSIGGITSSRCTNEEVYVVQKLIRAAFGNNNVDTCARVCHSPTGYGLSQTLGTSAGTQDFKSVEDCDVIFIIGANPTDAHPVFASRMKQRIRQGAKLIIADPRAIDLVHSAHIHADYFLPLLPGMNVALINALSHVIVTEELLDNDFIEERCDLESFAAWAKFVALDENSPESQAKAIGVNAKDMRQAARLYATGGNAGIYYGLGVTEHSQGSTMVMGIANLAMATGNLGKNGGGVNPLRGQNNVQGSCDMGSFPHELPGYRSVADDEIRHVFEAHWGIELDAEPGYRIPNMFNQAITGNYKGMYVQGEDIAQSDPDTQHVEAALSSLDCLIVQDLFLNETARYAHIFLPGTSFLEKDGTFTNAERRINRVRMAMPPATGKHEWEVTQDLAIAMGYDMDYQNSSQIMDEIAELTPAFSGVSHQRLDAGESLQWPVNDQAPNGTPIMHVGQFARGKGKFFVTEFTPTTEKANRKFPLLLTTGRVLSQYNVGAQTRRTKNNIWLEQDVLEIHTADAELRGIADGDLVQIASRKGKISVPAKISDRMQIGVVYTTFHHPETGANVITTENSDWATDCPEYKVTAVQVRLTNDHSAWQSKRRNIVPNQHAILPVE
ncbi:MAG: formate dehydrogenase subunit alpha [Rhizobiales bacterium]|nr:formate dehydrogenase subunit alpha [Hyphomicrobiales bacterium]NRB13267.1 formate dehydrogenase subunit alpha [Hyphomicrobiales bacterium]